MINRAIKVSAPVGFVRASNILFGIFVDFEEKTFPCKKKTVSFRKRFFKDLSIQSCQTYLFSKGHFVNQKNIKSTN